MSSISNNWFDQLDAIDPFFGDQEQLDALKAIAPTPEIAAWLSARIEENARFKAVFFKPEVDKSDIFNPVLFQNTPDGKRIILKLELDFAINTIRKLRNNQPIIAIIGMLAGFVIASISQYFTHIGPGLTFFN